MKKESSMKQLPKSPKSFASARAFVKTIRSVARRYALWDREAKIVIAVSGGCDSMALLHFFVSIRHKDHVSLVVAHIHYGLRGSDSDADARLVSEYCEKNNLEVFVHRVKNAPRDEASLRNIRFRFFESVRERTHSDVIALAHHRDDQVETVLLRLLRGSGRQGLSAMRTKRDAIIRPFLFVSRADIRAYAQMENIPFREDGSNFETKYLRNRVRNELLPSIRSRINPNIDETLENAAKTFADEDMFLEEELRKRFLFEQGNNEARFSLEKWRKLPEALQRRAIRWVISSVLGSVFLRDMSFRMIEEVRFALLSSKPKSSQVRFLGLIVERKGDTIRIVREEREYIFKQERMRGVWKK
jgi:tRNA(Ile)-lysidine synthase